MKFLREKVAAILLASPLAMAFNACTYGPDPIYILYFTGCRTNHDCWDNSALKDEVKQADGDIKEWHCMDNYCTDCNTLQGCIDWQKKREDFSNCGYNECPDAIPDGSSDANSDAGTGN